MKVKDLIKELQEQDPNAEVIVMSYGDSINIEWVIKDDNRIILDGY